MIDQQEFERRVNIWFALIMNALGDNVRRLLNEGKPFTPDDLDDPTFTLAMLKAAAFQANYLPDEVLAQFLDPALLTWHFQNTSRLESLLQQGLMQKAAGLQAIQCIERARQRA